MESSRIGINSAHSILRNATQSKLSLFHKAGTVSSGFNYSEPSIQDVMELNKSMKCSMKFKSTNKEFPYKDLLSLHFSDIVKSFVFIRKDKIIEDELCKCYTELTSYKYRDQNISRIIFDFDKLTHYGIVLDDIYKYIDYNEYDIVMYPNILCTIDVYSELISFTSSLNKHIRLVDNITDIIHVNDEYIANGSNLQHLMLLDDIDITSVTSNNPRQIMNLFGIEAARNCVYNKLVYESNNEESSRIISDFMGRNGTLLPFSRSSLEVDRKGSLFSMAFEQPKLNMKRNVEKNQKEFSIYSKIMTNKFGKDKAKNDIKDYF